MANVRLSESIRDKINNNAHNLFNKALERNQEKLADDFFDRLAEEIIDIKINSLDVMQRAPINIWPKEWTVLINQLYCTFPYDGEQISTGYVELIKKYRVPKCSNLISGYGRDRLEVKNFQPSHALLNEYLKIHLKDQEILQERSAFCDQIRNILRQCNTLKQFLDAWPQGENLVPPEVMRKHNEPTQKRERVKPAEPELKQNFLPC